MPTANKLFLFLLLLHKITVVNGSYVEVVTGTCASVANRGALGDMVACEAGKTALGLNTHYSNTPKFISKLKEIAISNFIR